MLKKPGSGCHTAMSSLLIEGSMAALARDVRLEVCPEVNTPVQFEIPSVSITRFLLKSLSLGLQITQRQELCS